MSALRLFAVLGVLLVACVAWSKADTILPSTPNAYIIHSGDQLNIQVYGDQSLTQTVTVLQDGTIDYPLIGRVPVGGKTPSQATAMLRKDLLRFVRDPFVTIAVTQVDQPDVMVLGDVKNPGKYVLRQGAHVADAIAAAGGFNDDINGPLPDARVADAAGNTQVVPLEQLFHKGNLADDYALGDGSVVYIPGPEHFVVNVAGAVDHPGQIRMNDGDRLSMAIAKAGNSANSNADLNHIRVTHTNPNGTRTVQEINLYDALEQGHVESDITLQANDLVYVPQATKHDNSALGGMFYLLRSLIPF